MVSYEFARKTNSVPLTAAEFAHAVRHYPIVFTTGQTPVPIALVGIRQDQNLFVQGDGSWRSGVYIPAYVRRYPFLLADQAGDKLSLCIDEESEHYQSGGEVPLFAEDGPSPEVQAVLEFCGEYHNQWRATQEFTQALVAEGLLEDKQIKMTEKGTNTATLTGFATINEEKLLQVSDDKYLDWRKRGWIVLIYCHLISMGAVQNLIEIDAGNAKG